MKPKTEKSKDWPDLAFSAGEHGDTAFSVAMTTRAIRLHAETVQESIDGLSRALWALVAQGKEKKEERQFAKTYDAVSAGIVEQYGSADGYGLLADRITRQVLELDKPEGRGNSARQENG